MLGLGIGIVTLPTAFQMFRGRPKLRITFDTTEVQNKVLLRCGIRNEPINNNYLRILALFAHERPYHVFIKSSVGH